MKVRPPRVHHQFQVDIDNGAVEPLAELARAIGFAQMVVPPTAVVVFSHGTRIEFSWSTDVAEELTN